MQTPKKSGREGITQMCTEMPSVQDGDHKVEKTVGLYLLVYCGSKVGQDWGGIHNITTCPGLPV